MAIQTNETVCALMLVTTKRQVKKGHFFTDGHRVAATSEDAMEVLLKKTGWPRKRINENGHSEIKVKPVEVKILENVGAVICRPSYFQKMAERGEFI